MDDLELVALFTGYGYQVRFVGYGTLPNSKAEAEAKTVALNKSMAVSMEWAYQEIRLARSSSSLFLLMCDNATSGKSRQPLVAASLSPNLAGRSSSCARPRYVLSSLRRT